MGLGEYISGFLGVACCWGTEGRPNESRGLRQFLSSAAAASAKRIDDGSGWMWKGFALPEAGLPASLRTRTRCCRTEGFSHAVKLSRRNRYAWHLAADASPAEARSPSSPLMRPPSEAAACLWNEPGLDNGNGHPVQGAMIPRLARRNTR